MKQLKIVIIAIMAMTGATLSFAEDAKLPTTHPKFEPDAEYTVEKFTSNQIIVEALEKFKAGLEDLENKLKNKDLDVSQVTLLLNAIQARQNQLTIIQQQRLIDQNEQVIKQNQKIIELLEQGKKIF